MTKKIIVAFVAAMLAFTNILATPAAVAAECPLCQAAHDGDVSEVKRLIAAGADVNAESTNGRAALIWAAQQGWRHTAAETVKILLDAGADVNAKDEYGRAALIWPAWDGHAEVAKILLDAGADVNAKDNNGDTALMAAVKEGHTEVAKILLESGANANATNSEGKTVLDYATLKTLPLIIMVECSEVKADTPLPPEIYADRKLVEIERILDGEDYLSAAIAMKFIRCYSDSNNISLPSEFHFKEAQILLLAQLPQAAKSAVILYLQESGRDGEHYLEALQLFDKLESQ